MKKHKNTGHMAKKVKFCLKEVVKATAKTSSAIIAAIASGLVTPSIHVKGAHRNGVSAFSCRSA